MLKIKAHTCYLGETGYANHARNFFRNLSEHFDLRVRNFTWDDDFSKLTDQDFKILNEITLKTAKGSGSELTDFYFRDYFKDERFIKDENFQPDIDIVLETLEHHYFYQTDKLKGKIKIAFNVWESTELPEGFINHLDVSYDYIWVVTEWHKEMLIKQGIDKRKIFVINEGVDADFYPSFNEDTEKFKFLLFGRWDYRKSITEIVKAFNEEFQDENVELILNADNPYSVDGLSSTEERLKYYGLENDKIKIINFLSKKEYIDYIRNGDVFLSCARSEGWNIPLIEALASGTPCIYSNYGAQLEFAKNKGNPVEITGLKKATVGDDKTYVTGVPGYYCEPDFEDLKTKMRYVYENYKEEKERALKDSEEIRKKYNWKDISLRGASVLYHILSLDKENEVKINYINGCKLETKGDVKKRYNVKFINSKTDEIVHEGDIENNWWIKSNREYFTNWNVVLKDLDKGYVINNYTSDVKHQRVYIALESKSLGDTLAWIPYVEEFRKKHGCVVICSTFLNSLFKETYPNIEFIEPTEIVNNINAQYNIGWFYNGDVFDDNKNPQDFKKIPLQQTSSDILGLEYKEIIPNITIPTNEKTINGKYVCIAIHSTAQCKYWNYPNGWQIISDHLVSLGYKVVLVSREEDGYMGNKEPKGKGIFRLDASLLETADCIRHSEFFMGIGSGLSWLAWAVKTTVILVSGFSEDYTETNKNTHRVINKSVCNGCFNKFQLDAGDWNWCPENKGTPRQFECTKKITPEMVIQKIHLIHDKF